MQTCCSCLDFVNVSLKHRCEAEVMNNGCLLSLWPSRHWVQSDVIDLAGFLCGCPQAAPKSPSFPHPRPAGAVRGSRTALRRGPAAAAACRAEQPGRAARTRPLRGKSPAGGPALTTLSHGAPSVTGPPSLTPSGLLRAASRRVWVLPVQNNGCTAALVRVTAAKH